MSEKNQVIFLQKEGESLCFNSPKSKNALALIPSNLCIYHTFEINEENPLLKAYQNKLLAREQGYLCFSFSTKLQNNLSCFFAPLSLLSYAKFAMLDLSLPTQVPLQSLCVLFIYQSNALLCFYQNQVLQYCKILQYQVEDINLCKHYLATLFEYNAPLYCLSYIQPLPPLFQPLELAPLSSLFISSPPDFGIHFKQISILSQEGIVPLTSPPSRSLKLLKFILYTFVLFTLSTFAFCTFVHSPPPDQIKKTHTLQILSTLQSLPSNKPLFLLLQTLSANLKNIPLLELNFHDQILKITFAEQIPRELMDALAFKGYIFKVLDPSTLEIAL